MKKYCYWDGQIIKAPSELDGLDNASHFPSVPCHKRDSSANRIPVGPVVPGQQVIDDDQLGSPGPS
jgi:hypothetical protein